MIRVSLKAVPTNPDTPQGVEQVLHIQQVGFLEILVELHHRCRLPQATLADSSQMLDSEQYLQACDLPCCQLIDDLLWMVKLQF